MKANELRIGNLAQTNMGDLLIVENLSLNDIHFKVVDRSKYPLNYKWQAEPIPLTEEWLLKLGFEYDTITYSKEFLTLAKSERLTGYHVFINSLVNRLSNNVVYVHQLQNLYFALTGEELTIKS